MSTRSYDLPITEEWLLRRKWFGQDDRWRHGQPVRPYHMKWLMTVGSGTGLTLLRRRPQPGKPDPGWVVHIDQNHPVTGIGHRSIKGVLHTRGEVNALVRLLRRMIPPHFPDNRVPLETRRGHRKSQSS